MICRIPYTSHENSSYMNMGSYVQEVVTGALFQWGLDKGCSETAWVGDWSEASVRRCWRSCACRSGTAMGASTERCKSLGGASLVLPMKRGLRQVGHEYVSASPWSSLCQFISSQYYCHKVPLWLSCHLNNYGNLEPFRTWISHPYIFLLVQSLWVQVLLQIISSITSQTQH